MIDPSRLELWNAIAQYRLWQIKAEGGPKTRERIRELLYRQVKAHGIYLVDTDGMEGLVDYALSYANDCSLMRQFGLTHQAAITPTEASHATVDKS